MFDARIVFTENLSLRGCEYYIHHQLCLRVQYIIILCSIEPIVCFIRCFVFYCQKIELIFRPVNYLTYACT